MICWKPTPQGRPAAALGLAVSLLAGCGARTSDNAPAPSAASVPPGSARAASIEPATALTKPSIRLRSETGLASGTRFEVVGLPANDLISLASAELSPAQWASLFSVYALPAGSKLAPDQPPVLGTRKVEGETLQFIPRFPPEPGLTYRAVFDPSQLPGSEAGRNAGSQITAEFALPKPTPAATTELTHIYPSRETLPENQLKFYLHFSAPMSRGEVYNRVKLLKADGKPVELPFLELGEELWDPSGTRLTLFFSPGRIKKGLKPREELGPILEEGKSYTLVVDRGWPDAEGNPLVADVRKPIKAGPVDETQPDPANWVFSVPAAGTADRLSLTFPEPLDHAMLERVLVVLDAQGQPVAGDVEVEAEETRWVFAPRSAWSAGKYTISVDTALEDLAGNSIRRPFEVDVVRPIERKVEAQTVALPFEVKPAAASSRHD